MLIYAVLLLQIVTQPLTRDKADLKTQGEDGKSQLLLQTKKMETLPARPVKIV